ncbi:MAG TPA: hypothetical protein DDZ80_30635 [Cyanobacteria bacterium UBA8803]|nr:hypothetical protein [Cyanobacteria bacterium UBA9273]HBL62584.1 hypothetical protein [Cyanobacteria bacterium UBA8803]
MPYSQFTTLASALNAFSLTLSEQRFFPTLDPIAPSEILRSYLEETLPIAASGSEKMRSEGIIYPVLIEVRRILNRQVAVFSGEDFSVDEAVGLNGIVDFLISRSPIISTIVAPAAVIVEAKKADIKSGYGQCVAEMVAAQRFNQVSPQILPAIFGCVSNGTQWRFLQLKEQTVTIDLTDYPLPPVEQILGFLVWMLQQS